ncbi:signal recognition particle-docking protein FtsY [Anaerolinea thermolimosa]|uniref:signal recognition particle-docking protein FtsY n=1 Tax=Anaerolinea thermolimosa TaxID=229919 RepID=UPI000785034B|nr:signal recognition particle-docking protein FtsY [Anaerolinea thermolimosa]GAP06732.1 signal recognition particle-docking protein FtsY [Anaerolinea thermolimosa]
MATTFFSRWKTGLERTRKVAFGRLSQLFGATKITEDIWDELEAILIQADLGVNITQQVIATLHKRVFDEGLTQPADLQKALQEELLQLLEPAPHLDFSHEHPAVILLVGVNGSGKTTTAAKLAALFTSQKKSVILAAADTFRAAAVDQLQVWGERLKVPVIAGQPNADPGAVAYDAVQAAIARKADYLLVDTAGRLHTRTNLMEELKKVYRVIGKALPGAPHATWLVLDATTGQNALNQARSFKEAVNVTGIILTKLDSSAHGGMAFAIQNELHLPILYAGLGEKPDDLQVFDRQAFVENIFEPR